MAYLPTFPKQKRPVQRQHSFCPRQISRSRLELFIYRRQNKPAAPGWAGIHHVMIRSAPWDCRTSTGVRRPGRPNNGEAHTNCGRTSLRSGSGHKSHRRVQAPFADKDVSRLDRPRALTSRTRTPGRPVAWQSRFLGFSRSPHCRGWAGAVGGCKESDLGRT